MSERFPEGPQRAHWAFVAVRTIKAWRELVIPVFAAFIFGAGDVSGRGWSLLAPLALVVFALGAPIFAVVAWYRFSYEITEGELRVYEGLVFRKQTFIPGRRVHAVDVSSGLFERFLGVVRVRVQTAGGGDTPEATLLGLTLSDAERLRAALIALSGSNGRTDQQTQVLDESQAAAATHDGVQSLAGTINEVRGIVAGAAFEPTTPDYEYRLDARGLLLAASTSGRMWIVLAAGFGFISQLANEFGMTDKVFEQAGALGVGAFILLGLGAVVLSWVVAVVTTALAYAGFTVRRTGQRLEVERGLLEHQLVSVPLDRVQAVRVTEGPVRRLFGYAEVHVDTAGYGSSEADQSRTVLHPFIRSTDVPAFIETVLPKFIERPTVDRLPRRAARRYVIRWVVPAMLVVAPAAFFPALWWVWIGIVLVLPAAGLGIGSYRNRGWGVTDRTLVLQQGVLGITTHYIPRRRIQSFAVKQNPFQVRARLATITTAIVSGSSGKHLTLAHIDRDDAAQLLAWYAPRDDVQVGSVP